MERGPSVSVNYEVATRDLKYYVFDWDDNILHMPTKIYLERRTDDGEWVPHAVSTAVFSIIRTDSDRYRPENADWELACRDFRDGKSDTENVFLRHTREAIDRVVDGELRPAPSFLRFKKALIEGRLFAIVTARGHAPTVIRTGVEYFIERVLSRDEKQEMLRNLRGYLVCFVPDRDCGNDEDVLDYYLRHNRYHGIRSSEFKDLMKQHGRAGDDTEAGKQFAIRDFVRHILQITRERELKSPISIGFSDDDVLTASAVEDYIRSELGPEFPSIKFVVYYTSDREHPSGRKVEVHGQLSLPLADADSASL